jgi:FkbM family methyltransferase
MVSQIDELSQLEAKYSRDCFSWEGEDIILEKILMSRFKTHARRFIDVGAHHPIIYSNTYRLYKEGWRGINIDATPGSMELFRQIRPQDINVETGVAKRSGSSIFSIFENPALNGFLSDEIILSHINRGEQLLRQCEVECHPLSEILRKHDVPNAVDLLSVDVEGLDLEVLQSNDFTSWRPKLIACEILGMPDLLAVGSAPIAGFLKSQGYELFSKLDFTCIFIDITQ